MKQSGLICQKRIHPYYHHYHMDKMLVTSRILTSISLIIDRKSRIVVVLFRYKHPCSMAVMAKSLKEK